APKISMHPPRRAEPAHRRRGDYRDEAVLHRGELLVELGDEFRRAPAALVPLLERRESDEDRGSVRGVRARRAREAHEFDRVGDTLDTERDLRGLADHGVGALERRALR